MENMKDYVVFVKDSWVVELRPRNLTHEGEPTMKVWVVRHGQEVAHYTDKFRGYGHYKDHEELLPAEISEASKKAWEKLKEAPFDDALFEDIKQSLSE
ncbi:MAG: hypothetical protein IJM25_08080 [Eubacterium sp.]|jgi:hypothetical protein|nr:hypothetical protein [Eubacterium sp.]